MFQFRRFPAYAYLIQRRLTEYCSAGFPHSVIPGSMDMCSSPRLIAACHDLLRLLMPRHSPCALCSLTSRGLSPASGSLLENYADHREVQFRLCCFYPFLRASTISRFILPLLLLALHLSIRCSVFKVRSLCFQLPLKPDPNTRPRRMLASNFNQLVVGQSGLEPPTSRLSVVCSNQLSYWPAWWRLPDSNR